MKRLTTKPITYETTGTLIKPDGSAMVTIDRLTHGGSAVMFSTGWCASKTEAEEMAAYILNLGDKEIMKLLKNDKLFPHIKAIMLKEKRVTLHLSGKVNIVTVKGRGKKEPDSYKAELFFTDRKKTAMINENQTLVIIGIYGDDTDDWKGQPIVLYGEEGDWFGKHQWALRVDDGATYAAINKEGKPEKKTAEVAKPKPVAKPQPMAEQFTEEKEHDIEQLGDDLFDDPNAAQQDDLFGNGEPGTPHNYKEA